MFLICFFTFLLAEYPLILLNKVFGLVKTQPPEKWLDGEKGDVILLPGHSSEWIFMETIGNFLSKKGYRIYIIPKLGNNTLPLKKSVEILRKFVLSKKFKNVILVCHSKGGIIAKLFLDSRLGGARVKKIVSIATPYQGTYLGVLGFSNINELIPGSDYIKEINDFKRKNKKILSLYAKCDNHVIPNSSPILPGAKNKMLNVVGHTRILECQETLDEIGKYI